MFNYLFCNIHYFFSVKKTRNGLCETVCTEEIRKNCHNYKAYILRARVRFALSKYNDSYSDCMAVCCMESDICSRDEAEALIMKITLEVLKQNINRYPKFSMHIKKNIYTDFK